MNKRLLIAGIILAVLGIILGAFAAHGLKAHISADHLLNFKTGVRYQMYHAFLLIILGSTNFVNFKTKELVFWLVLFGVIFFSGSIYGLATNALTTFNFKRIALITPFGGLLLIAAWLILLYAVVKNKTINTK